MSHDKRVLVHLLGGELLAEYCQCHTQVQRLGKVYIRDELMLQIADRLKINYELLPEMQVVYKAFRREHCSSGFKEKLAVFYYIIKDPERAEELKAYCLRILARERLTATPCWDRYVEEDRQRNMQSESLALPVGLLEQLIALKPEEKRRVLGWLKGELEDERI